MRTRPTASFLEICTSGNGLGTKLSARRIQSLTGFAEESPKWYAGARNRSEELYQAPAMVSRGTV